jgi:integrase
MGVMVRQKTKGRGQPWWVFISHNGKRTSRKIGDRQAAEKVASEIRAKLQLGKFGFEEKKPVPIFQEYAGKFLERYSQPEQHKESTQESYESVLRLHLYPTLKNKPLDQITKEDVKDLISLKLDSGLSKSTVKLTKAYLSSILSEAVDDDIISMNPARSLGKKFMKVFNGKDPAKDINPLTPIELKTLLDTVETHYTEHYPLFLLLARTGMRIGEALALQWGDVDFAGRFITVSKSLVRGRISTPKSGKARRVDVSLQLLDALKHHKLASKKKGLSLGLGDAPKYVFTDMMGGPIDKDNWRRRIFNKALEKAGLRKIRIHDMRHTYATLRISKGDNISDVSKQLGHYSVKLTLDVYYHWMPGGNKRKVDALDDFFEGQKKVIDGV